MKYEAINHNNKNDRIKADSLKLLILKMKRLRLDTDNYIFSPVFEKGDGYIF